MATIFNSKHICKEDDKFYLDTEEYKDVLGMKIHSGELVKFTYDNKIYIGKTEALYGVKDLFILKNITQQVI